MKTIWRALVIGAAMSAAGGTTALAEPDAGYGGKGGEVRGPRPHGRGGPGVPGMDFPHPRILKELGLSEDQQRKLKEQRLEAQKQRIRLQAEKAALELDLRNVLSTHPVKEGEAAKLAGKIADVDRRALLLRVETLGRFLAGLTPEQHRKMMDHQEEMREKRRAWREEMHKGWRGDGSEGPDGPGGDRGPDRPGAP